MYWTRFGAQVGGEIGAKLAPESKEIEHQDNAKKSSKIWSRAGWQAADPLAPNRIPPGSSDTRVQEYKCPAGKSIRDTPLSGQRPGG